jgi:hypothetical protein
LGRLLGHARQNRHASKSEPTSCITKIRRLIALQHCITLDRTR